MSRTAPARSSMLRRGSSVLALALVAIAASSCSSDGDNDSNPAASVGKSYAVGERTETYVDSSRGTAANGAAPERSDRTLETLVLYPADGTVGAAPIEDAAPATKDSPYPLIVFGHGLGADPAFYEGVLRSWAKAGYVVAAPRFPLTNATASGGVDAGDFSNQPDDMRFVITSVLEQSADVTDPLNRMVDPDSIGIAGHSLGAVTTLGVAAHTCCQDPRVEAAVVMSPDPLSFKTGHFDYDTVPPILLVHGVDDDLVPYHASVDVFNAVKAPKGLVTIKGGNHDAPVNPEGPAFASVVRTTTDFFDAYLKGDDAARARIAKDADSGVTTVRFIAQVGSDVTIPTTTLPPRNLEATATPNTGLTNGQPVKVDWSGYTPGGTITIVQCAKSEPGDANACNLKTGKILQPNPTGSGSLSIPMVVGPVGTGICDAAHPGCVIVVNDSGSLDESASLRLPISFAP